MSDRRRNDRPLPPAPQNENGDGPGTGQHDEESNHEVLVAPPESA